jgi:hypothetical protein
MDETDVLNNVFNSVYEDYKTRLNTSVVDDLRSRLSEVDTKDVNEWMQEQEVKSKALDALFNPDATMAVPSQYRAQPVPKHLVGTSATHVWLDDPWDI